MAHSAYPVSCFQASRSGAHLCFDSGESLRLGRHQIQGRGSRGGSVQSGSVTLAMKGISGLTEAAYLTLTRTSLRPRVGTRTGQSLPELGGSYGISNRYHV